MKKYRKGLLAFLIIMFVLGPILALITALSRDAVFAWLTFVATLVSPMSLIYLVIKGGYTD